MVTSNLPRSAAMSVLLSVMLSLAGVVAYAVIPDKSTPPLADGLVAVLAYDSLGHSHTPGSGVIVGQGQVILPCAVIAQAARIQVRHKGVTFDAAPEYRDLERELCQLSVPELTVSPVALATSKTLNPGQAVRMIGATGSSVHTGNITQARDYGKSQYLLVAAHTSANLTGAGLFNEADELIGLTSSHLTNGRLLTFALPADWIPGLAERAQSRQQPTKGLAWINESMALEAEQNWVELRKHAEQWSSTEPERAPAWHSLGLAYARLDQNYKAVQAYQQALTLQPDNLGALQGLGAAYLDLEQYVKAVETYEDVMSLRPDEAGVRAKLGIVYHQLGEFDEAVESYLEALNLTPRDLTTMSNLGIAYGELKQFDKANELYMEMLRIDSRKEIAWYSLGNIHYQTAVEQPGKLEKLFQKLLRKVLRTGLDLNEVYQHLGQYEQAILAYQEALKINPDFYRAWYNLGMSYQSIGEYEQAIEAYRKGLSINPDAALAWNNLGTAYYRLNQYDEAIAAYRKALDKQPKLVLAWSNLGITYAAEGQAVKVREVYLALRELDPTVAERFSSQLIFAEPHS